MKVLVFCACLLGFASFNLADSEIKVQLKNARSTVLGNFVICMRENNVTEDDLYTDEEIITGVHEESGNEEKTRKLSCTIACSLTKEEVMEGSNIDEKQLHKKISEKSGGDPIEGKLHKIARNCVTEVKDITEKCEKALSFYTCAIKALHKLEEAHGVDEEHETHEVEEIEENTETEQTI